MAKSPYEIRLDLLNLAFGILNEQAGAKRLAEEGRNIHVPSPTVEEVISAARRLNEFVSTDKNTRGDI